MREATDLTNELLTQNAANLRESNRIVREEMERGVFDIEAVKQANAELIATIEESLQIADEGKRRRAEAETEMQKMEAELRDTLASASARAPQPAPGLAGGRLIRHGAAPDDMAGHGCRGTDAGRLRHDAGARGLAPPRSAGRGPCPLGGKRGLRALLPRHRGAVGRGRPSAHR